MIYTLIPIFILGSAIGSFINVLADRIARGESIKGRSHCENCDKKLSVKDLIPVVSYLTLKGKCRYCGAKLSLQYPLTELATGIVFSLIYYLLSTNQYTQVDYLNFAVHITDYGIIIPLLFYFIIATSLIALFITDLKYGMLYDKIMIPTIIFVLLYKVIVIAYYAITSYNSLNATEMGRAFIQAGMIENHLGFATKILLYNLAGSIGIALFFLILIIVTKGRGMGGGDLKLGFLIGLLTGWPNMLIAIFLGFLTGAIASCILLLIGRKKFRQTIPFGPFLIIGCFTVIFYGNQLFNWYLVEILGLK